MTLLDDDEVYPLRRHRPRRPRVTDIAIRKMVYMPPGAARRLEQLALDDGCKENDIFLEAVRRFFTARGIKDTKLWEMKPEKETSR